MATRKLSWVTRLLGKRKSKSARRKPVSAKPRYLLVESLEARTLLSGSSLSTLLAQLTPDPHPSGDQPADISQEVPLANYTADPLPPGLGISPEITAFITGLEQVYADIQNNSAARPDIWGDTVADTANEYRLHLDDNGMLITNWTIDWGDGSNPQTISAQPWVIHQYGAAGQYTILVTADGRDGTYTGQASTGGFTDSVGIGGSGDGGLQATVPPAPPTLHVATAQTVAQGQTFALDNLASLSDPDTVTVSNGVTNDFNYTIDWGDGSQPMTGICVDVIAQAANGSPFLGTLTSTAGDGPLTHVYSNTGTYYLAVTVTDGTGGPSAGLSDTQTIPINVVELTPTISVSSTPITVYSCTEGTTVTLNSSASVVDSSLTDPVAYNWQILDSSGDTVAQGTDPTISYTFTGPDTYTVSLVTSVDTVTSVPATATVTVSSVAPTITSSAILGSANVGQSFTLSGVSFTDSGINDTHIASINWGDGSTSDNAQVTEPYLGADGITEIPGTITDSHIYTAAMNYTGSITITDESGNVATQGFSVSVATGVVTLGRFAPSASVSSQVQVSYTVSNAPAAPFNIDIYTSLDGRTPGQLLMSYPITNSGLLTVTSGAQHTVSFSVAFDDIASDFHLIAVSDANSNPAENSVEFAGGIFVAASVTASPPQNILYVFGTDSGSGDTVDIYGNSGNPHPNTVVFDGGLPFSIGSIITGIHVRGEDGNDTFQADPDVTLPLWLYGGTGNNTLVGGNGGDTIMGGGGQNVIHDGNGWNSPEIVDDSDTQASFPTLDDVFQATPGGDWTSNTVAGAFNGEELSHAASSGTDNAKWTFANLDSTAYYDVYVTWSPLAGASTAAQYSVYDLTAPIYPIGQTSITTVDQSQAPNDVQQDGMFWHDLGVYQATSGTLNVQLGTDSTGETLADAVMIVSQPTAPLTNLTMGSFSVDSVGNLSVSYTINGEDSAPFTIGIYDSPDGHQAGNLLQSYDVTDPTLLVGGGQTYTVSFPANFSPLGKNCYFVAQLDSDNGIPEANETAVTSQPLSGTFQTPDGSLYVITPVGSATDNVLVTQDASTGDINLTVNGIAAVYQNVPQINIALCGGGGTVDASAVSVPLWIHASSGSCIITGGSGNNEIYGGSGSDWLDGGSGQNNWIDGGSGNQSIDGGAGNDWITCGTGNDVVSGGSGNEVITGGSGTDWLYAGTGSDELYSGTGVNYLMEGRQHDILDGTQGTSTIGLLDTNSLQSVQVLAPFGLASSDSPEYSPSVAVDKNDVNWPQSWDFSPIDSGARLGEDATTPLAVYVCWNPSDTPGIGTGNYWSSDAQYTVYDGSTPLATVDVNQQSPCPYDSPDPSDHCWMLLGVYNVTSGSLKVVLRYGEANPPAGEELAANDAMVRAIWPTVSIRADQDGTGQFSAYDDYLNATAPAEIPIEGGGTPRLAVQLSASVDPLYAQIAGASMSDWQVVLPNVPGLEFWTAASGGTQLTPDGNGNLIDQSLPGSGQYQNTVWVSVDPNYGAPVDVSQIAFTVDPDGASVTANLSVIATVIPVYYPTTKYGRGTVMMNVNATIDPTTNVLTVSSTQGSGYKNYENVYPFYQVMDGSFPMFKDTDSLQFAVQWTQGVTEVKHFCNAGWTNPAYQGVRPRSAKWSNDTVGADKSVSCEVGAAPTNADSVTIVMVYTDTFEDTPADFGQLGSTPHGNGAGDMPDIVGYWTGSKDAKGVWHLTPKSDQLSYATPASQLKSFPNAAQIANNVAKATNALSGIGYNLAWRPNTPAFKAAVTALTNAYAANPNGDMTTLKANILAAIDAAMIAAKINPPAGSPPPPDAHSHDTGFDIQPKPGDPWYPG